MFGFKALASELQTRPGELEGLNQGQHVLRGKREGVAQAVPYVCDAKAEHTKILRKSRQTRHAGVEILS